jgi:pimeloyl-ACP methyl ester carboxylesterase/class 3 adenylate cyclase
MTLTAISFPVTLYSRPHAQRMTTPATRYAKGRGGCVAYQVIGDGPLDLVFIPDWVTNVEVMWDEPSLARFLRRLASFSRLICFDKRGTGVSDPQLFDEGLSVESWLDDTCTVLEALGTERAAMFGHAEGGRMAMLFAATFPEKTSALVLLDSFARRVRDLDYPGGVPEEVLPRFFESFDLGWGNGTHLNLVAPSVAQDPRFREWYGRYQRLAMGPTQAAQGYRNTFRFEVRGVLPAIRVPTLVLHRKDNTYIRAENGRYLAEHIAGAQFVEVPGEDHLYHIGETGVILDAIQEFLTGRHEAADEDRVLATVLFADIVRSTERAAQLGDRAWGDLLQSYYGVARRAVAQFRGREIDTAGDGFFAAFDGPARAIRSACAIRDSAAGIGLTVRAGLHTGECEKLGDKVGGLAVHIGARVAGHADPGEVLVSRTVRDLVVGSGIQFAARGTRVLKGVPGEWSLYSVES